MKTIIVSGANSGIGKYTTLALVKDGHQVVMACRNLEKAAIARDEILQKVPAGKVEIMQVDFSEADSVDAFAERFIKKYSALDILVNNAGIWNTSRKENSKHFEAMFATNHLGYVYGTYKLMPALRAAEKARIVNVSSNAHRWANDSFEDLQWENRKWNSTKAYGASKMYNIWFTNALSRRLPEHITVNALHPGVISTNLAEGWIGTLQKLASPFLKTPEQGAQTSIYLANSPDVENISGKYFSNKKERRANTLANNDDLSEKMWDISDTLLNIHFDDCLR